MAYTACNGIVPNVPAFPEVGKDASILYRLSNFNVQIWKTIQMDRRYLAAVAYGMARK